MPTQVITVAPEIRAGRNKLAATVTLGHAIKHIFNSALSVVILPEIKISMNLSGTQLGALSTSQHITSWSTTMISGFLGDRFANRAALMLFTSLSLVGISYLLVGVAPNFWMLFAAMLLVGIGPSLYHSPAIGALSRRFPDKRGFAISLHGTGGSVGGLLGPLIFAGLLAWGLTWRSALQVSVIPALVCAVLIWSMMRSVPGTVPGSRSTRDYLLSIGRLLRMPALAILVIVTALRSMGQTAIMTFLPVYLREDLDYSAWTVALFLSLAQVVGVGSQPMMGFFSDRFGRKIVLVPGMLAMGLLFFALKYADPGVQLVLVILAMGAVLYALHTIFIAAAMDIAGGEVQSTVVSLIYGASFLSIISPLIAGYIVDTTTTTNAFLYGGAVVLFATVILALLRMPRTANQVASGRGRPSAH